MKNVFIQIVISQYGLRISVKTHEKASPLILKVTTNDSVNSMLWFSRFSIFFLVSGNLFHRLKTDVLPCILNHDQSHFLFLILHKLLSDLN